jgi:DNA polymerase-3 subunit delta'
VTAPREASSVIGHAQVQADLLGWIEAGRLPPALILGGEAGIGKATLAFVLAKSLLESRRDAQRLEVEPESGSARRVAMGSHGNVITVERQRDPDSGKPAKEIAVEDVRRIEAFLRLSANEGGWRIAIVDEAAHLNRAGQNALLKILEEPPERSVLILVCDRPGMLLPTIHSRCRLVRLKPLGDAEMAALLDVHAPDLDVPSRDMVVQLAEGSIGRALQLLDHDGVALYREIETLFRTLPRPDWSHVHAFADRLSAPAADAAYRLFGEFAPHWIMARVKQTANAQGGGLDRWVAACEKVTQRLASTDTANLDRKLAVWSVFETMAQAF